MHRFKQCLGIVLIFLFLIIPFSTKASSDIYTPDNSVKTDPLQSAKQLRGNMRGGEFSGAAIYDYPLALPAGRNGMTPSVSLTYNSQDSSLDNIAGYKWSLNLFSIKRLNKKGIEKLHSEKDFIANTPIGGGELAPIQTSGQFGVYGEKIERSFAKYEYRANESWVITDKQGTKYTFGSNADSRQFDPADQSRTYQWMLSEIRDRNDNFIRYTYYKADNQIYPKTINYTSHGTEDGIFEVRFLPFAQNQTGAKRQDSHFSYGEGFLVETNYLVTGIEVIADNRLRRKYDISYNTIDPIIRQTISGIAETGYDVNGNATSLPPTTFEYTKSDVRWEESTDYIPRWLFETCSYECVGARGIYEWDMTGDGLVDFENYGDYSTPTRSVNDGNGGWIDKPKKFISSNPISESGIPSIWRKAVDFDGDARNEIISSYSDINDHTQIGSWIMFNDGRTIFNTIGVDFQYGGYAQTDNGASVADLNGDGLPDIIQSRAYYNGHTPIIGKKTCLNSDGNSCVLTNLWQAPEVMIGDSQNGQGPRTVYVQDCNYDGLADMSGTGNGIRAWVNDGKGGWINGSRYSGCQFSPMDSNLFRSADFNGDGYIDYATSYTTITDWGYTLTNQTYINTGNAVQIYQNLFPISLGELFNSYHQDSGVRIVDLNGDLLPDIIQSLGFYNRYTDLITSTRKVFMNKGSRPYFLKTVHTSEGARIDMEYKTSAQYLRDDGTQANPNLPIIITTITKITVDDGMGNQSEVNYFYEDGHYYFYSASEREMAGFRVITKTDGSGYKTKTYYHQSESSVAGADNGEFDDHISKKGMPYRTEIYDNQNKIVKTVINKFEKLDLGNGRLFPYLKQTLNADHNPSSGQNKAVAQVYEYDGFGNPVSVIDYGEVNLNSNDGMFSDTGNDLIKQQNSYVQNLADYLVSLPAEQKTFGQNNQLINYQKIFYDFLPLSKAVKGNPTETDVWVNTTDSFVINRIKYNEYGMPVSQKNPRGYVNSITYDEFHLYPVIQTNPLGHISKFSYDATGNLLQSTDSNGASTKNSYDGFGRLFKTEIIDPKTNSFKTVKTVSYDDNSIPRTVHQTIYNDDDMAIDSYAYSDGLGRQIESKSENADGKWTTTASIYDERGNVAKSIQAYFSNSENFEQIDLNRIGTDFIYDALNRVISVTNPLGTSATSYNIWNKTIADPNSNKKDFAFDARGRLTEVIEYADDGDYRTIYSYDAPGNLIKITDALSNVRNFTYDSLGRRLSQTDAYKAGGLFGLWKYEYDENGNVTKRTDPLNKIVTYDYDALDRVINEDFTGAEGAELTFNYDKGQNGIGRLTNVAGQNYIHNIQYDLLGRTVADEKLIDDKNFVFGYDYDLMGGILTMTYPDGFNLHYDYDNAHLLSKVYDGARTFADGFKYTPLGQMAQIRLGGKIVTTNFYDPDQMYMLASKNSVLDSGAGLQNMRYQYDAMGNLMNLTDASSAETSKTVAYKYDKLYRLTEADYTNTGNQHDSTLTYKYDPIGNMMAKSDVGVFEYSGNNPHAVTKAGAHNFTYDIAGNMTMRDGNGMIYDYKNRLTQSGGNTAYSYDEGGQRIKKTDLATGNTKYYPSKYFETSITKETKYIFAGKLKIAKIDKKLAVTPPVDPVVPPVVPPPVDPPVVPPPVNPPGGGGGGGGGAGGDAGSAANNQKIIKQIIGHIKTEILIPPYSQSADASDLPKYMRPKIETNDDVDFKNLYITYGKDGAKIYWDKMGKQAEYFNIYRSLQPTPGKLSKHASKKIATIKPGDGFNSYSDYSIKNGEHYVYRIVALNKDKQIIKASIELNPYQIFITNAPETGIDFSKYTDKEFNKLLISDIDGLKFEAKENLKTVLIKLINGFKGYGKISARFIKCSMKRTGGKYCRKADEKELGVFVIKPHVK